MNAISSLLITASLFTAGLVNAGEPTTPDFLSRPASKDAIDAAELTSPFPTKRWALNGGVSFRKIGDVDFVTGISPDMIPNLFGMDTFTPPPGIGPADATADRTYDDGFVNIGAATPGSGLTTYWGYMNASQVQNGDLVYARVGGERRDVTIHDTAAVTGWNDDADWETGPFLELTYSVPIRPNLTAGFGVNFMSTDIDVSRGGLNTISQFQQLDVYDVTAIDTYPLNGIIPPGPGYEGSFAGPGPLLGNVPDSRAFPETLASTDTALFLDSIRDVLDLDLYTFGLGGTLNWIPHPQFFVAAQAGVALNLADWNGYRNELITQSDNGGPATDFSRRTVRADDQEVLWGLYLQSSLAWRLSETWALHGFARYDWNEDLEDRIGPSSFEVDLSGWSVGAGISLTF